MPEEEYTLGLRLKNSECHEHLTIAYLGKEKPDFQESDFKNFEKLDAKITGKEMLGPKKDIPVWLIVLNSEKDVFDLWKKYNVEQEHTKGLSKPNLHITIKPDSPDRKVGDVIEFSSLFAKRVGKHDPYFEVSF